MVIAISISAVMVTDARKETSTLLARGVEKRKQTSQCKTWLDVLIVYYIAVWMQQVDSKSIKAKAPSCVWRVSNPAY
jgi:hypothetical protein